MSAYQLVLTLYTLQLVQDARPIMVQTTSSRTTAFITIDELQRSMEGEEVAQNFDIDWSK